MATISKNLAYLLVENNGRYSDDPIPHSVIQYFNNGINYISYAVCYGVDDFIRYSRCYDTVTILWANKDPDFIHDEKYFS